MTFDPTSVEVTCVTLPKDHCVQVPWEYINVCGYSDQFCKLPHTYTYYIYYIHTYIHTTYYVQNEWSHSLLLNSVQARQKSWTLCRMLLVNLLLGEYGLQMEWHNGLFQVKSTHPCKRFTITFFITRSVFFKCIGILSNSIWYFFSICTTCWSTLFYLNFVPFWHDGIFDFWHQLHEYNLHFCLFLTKAEDIPLFNDINDIWLTMIHNSFNLHKCNCLKFDTEHPQNGSGKLGLNLPQRLYRLHMEVSNSLIHLKSMLPLQNAYHESSTGGYGFQMGMAQCRPTNLLRVDVSWP